MTRPAAPELDWFTADLLPGGGQLVVVRERTAGPQGGPGREVARLDAARSLLLGATLTALARALPDPAWPAARQAVLRAFAACHDGAPAETPPATDRAAGAGGVAVRAVVLGAAARPPGTAAAARAPVSGTAPEAVFRVAPAVAQEVISGRSCGYRRDVCWEPTDDAADADGWVVLEEGGPRAPRPPSRLLHAAAEDEAFGSAECALAHARHLARALGGRAEPWPDPLPPVPVPLGDLRAPERGAPC